MWLLGVVVRRYIDFLILLIPIPLVSVLFAAVIIITSPFQNDYNYFYFNLCTSTCNKDNQALLS